AAVDVLVNNAGLALGLEGADAVALDDWNTMVATNISGLIACTHAVLPGMVARGRGHVINIGSVAASNPYAGGTVYGASKAFVAQFTRSLKADMLGKGVRSTNIAPGMSETEFSLVRFKGDAERANTVYAGAQPLTADDIAEAVFWAASLPAHVNINEIEMMPACQAPSGPTVKRG
ncbi:MAG: SDR family NAD(P)-dependent oxidoreductase, partial [Pseudomonadota bacterium]